MFDKESSIWKMMPGEKKLEIALRVLDSTAITVEALERRCASYYREITQLSGQVEELLCDQKETDRHVADLQYQLDTSQEVADQLRQRVAELEARLEGSDG